jgi:hypothetical protein
MGRYYDYEDVDPCRPTEHQWGMNGICFVCNQSRQDLVAQAKRILELEKKDKFGRYAG